MPPKATSNKPRPHFDYTTLDTDTSRFVKLQTGEIRGLMKRTAQGNVKIGQRLIEVKAKLRHGQFLDWLNAEFQWSYPTAARFMQVASSFGQNYEFDNFAPSALYELAAPSTPAAVRAEAIARAEAGEMITHKTAKALKQKYAILPTKIQTKPEPELVSAAYSQPKSLPQSAAKPLEIVALHPQLQVEPQTPAPKHLLSQAVQSSAIPQLLHLEEDTPGKWWKLDGRHLLYCGNPNSNEFVARIPETVPLLLAFPSARIWHSRIEANASVVLTDYLLVFQKPELLDEVLEPLILRISRMGDVVVTCFLPSPDILSVISRLERRGVVAEPDYRRCNAVRADWKKARLRVERVN
ncbi:MAG: DUF3102 domain-containing protein [Chroococcidiopsidaceae cyanobacterium CP_BM_ER_R8_30]|nr:DUF3102 domain-containing protein [Chroococcidiopsidaceae cyanobacterium CP_BM_ER_R8_30]